MKKVRKAVDIPLDDLVALQALAARQGKNLKNCLEMFLHTLAEASMDHEISIRLKRDAEK